MSDEVKQRKIEHVSVALEQDVSAPQAASWNDIKFVHQALPEVDLDNIDTSITFLGHRLRYPIFVSSLTGGHPDVTPINRNLARAAEEYGLALGVGSQRAAIVNPELSPSYTVAREQAPNAFLIANIGAPQLIPQARHPAFTLELFQRAIYLILSNYLSVYINFVHELSLPVVYVGGVGVVSALFDLCDHIEVRVFGNVT
jgi:isopentenyl-diphosphate Delta-isomerase